MESGLPRFPRDFSCPVVLRIPLRVRSAFGYVTVTLCGPAFQRGSPSRRIDNSTHAVLQPPGASTGVWAVPISLAATLGISVDLFSSRYCDGSLPWVSSHPPIEFSGPYTRFTRVGFPIRISPGQSLLAAHRGFSQLATSFFACWRQGIHRTPLVA